MTFIEKINEVAAANQDQFGGTPESVPDWFIADLLNYKESTTQNVNGNVLTDRIIGLLIGTGEYGVIKVAAQSHASDAVRVLCNNVIEALEAFDFLETSREDYHTLYDSMIAGLFSAGLIAEQTKAALESLIPTEVVTVSAQSWAEQNNVTVTSRTVGIERGGKP